MDALNLSDTMEQERQRLNKVLEQIMEQRIALDQEERTVKIELAGIGVAPKGAHQGKVVIPLYNQKGEFLVYASVTGLALPKNWRPK